MTFCISTQVGCAMACAFCLTGKMGLVRNLTAGEIAGQVRVLAAATGMLDHPFNIVLMGMGEPLHNYDNTMKALRMLHLRHGLAVSPRRVTLSTVGIVPGLERMAREPLMPNLAVSLHATTDEQRSMLVPPNANIRWRRFSTHAAASRSRSEAASRSSTCCSRASTIRRRMPAGSRSSFPASSQR
jgi:23S rRNA (adenine2503-C2)-methyltransferase